MAKQVKGKLALGGLLLAGIGYVAGILTAPKSGKETRQDIQNTMAKAKSDAEKNLKKLHGELGDLVSQGTKAAKNVSATAKKDLNQAVKLGLQARDNAKVVLSALHEGEYDDKELQAAVKDASQAVNHLKKFVTVAKKSTKKSSGRGKKA